MSPIEVFERRPNMKGELRMSQEDRQRLDIMCRIGRGELKLVDGAKLLEISYRQMRRIGQRYRKEGASGLLHRLRGQPSNRANKTETRTKILSLLENQYSGFGPTLASEMLEENHGLMIHRETVRRYLIQAKLAYKTRRPRPHRHHRERKAHFGEMIQMDGSHHPWRGDKAGLWCLMNMVDDATGMTYAQFDTDETSEIAMKTLLGWIQKYGIPQSIYVDRKTVFRSPKEVSIEEQLEGVEPRSQFGKVCQRLGIKLIYANSPQAKGRVERNHGVQQDRLVKAIKLHEITAINEANLYLRKTYLPKFNRKFAKLPTEPANYHQAISKGVSLKRMICFEETRKIANDWTIRYENRIFQLKQSSRSLPKARATVHLFRHLDGSIRIEYQNKQIPFVEIKEKPEMKQPKNHVDATRSWKPAPNHPWRYSSFRHRPRPHGGASSPSSHENNHSYIVNQRTFLNC